MRIGVPREAADDERRVSMTPDVTGRLAARGHQIVVESGAGLQAGHRDHEYVDRGAGITDAGGVYEVDLVATVGRPGPLERLAVPGAVLGLLRPLDDPAWVASAAAAGATAFAFELVPRTTRAQVVDALSSQATVAGYQAVLEAAVTGDRFYPMLTTAAGTLRPAKVLVLGAGVAGLMAIATARRLGAVVSGFDVRSAAAEQVKSLGASFIEAVEQPQDDAAAGGYARQLDEDQQRRVIEGLAGHVVDADAVICTAAVPGRPAPRLIEEATVEAMRPGAVIVDLAASTGGNCALTRPGETIVHGGVTIMGATDLASRTPGHASQMYARNVAAFVELLESDGSIDVEVDDDIVRGSCATHGGVVVHPAVLAALEVN
ncbi:MAG: NAD(P) transhydrogenase subunit alpha [Acidimicrobiia bacterium]